MVVVTVGMDERIGKGSVICISCFNANLPLVIFVLTTNTSKVRENVS